MFIFLRKFGGRLFQNLMRTQVDEALSTAEHYFDDRIDQGSEIHALYVQMRDARHQRRNHGA